MTMRKPIAADSTSAKASSPICAQPCPTGSPQDPVSTMVTDYPAVTESKRADGVRRNTLLR
jgi:hypothetical protein